MSLTAKLETLARIHGRYQRAGRIHKTRILDEFCATCGGTPHLRPRLSLPLAHFGESGQALLLQRSRATESAQMATVPAEDAQRAANLAHQAKSKPCADTRVLT